MPVPERMGPARVIGWDIGGAHVKACLVEDGMARDVAQWPCPLWQGLTHLDAALARARERWPVGWNGATRHAATMTGEMVDLFATREEGVGRLAAHLAERLGPTLRLYAGRDGLVPPHRARRHWQAIASANWHASARWLATCFDDALLVDIGSTTTDLIPLRDGRVAARGNSDAERLASGELVYQGVVRTPLCALARRVPFAGSEVNVMNEFFATTADVYRLTGELDPAHDQQPTADNAGKDDDATRQRLARMIGRDARDADATQWLALARVWRAEQVGEILGQLQRVATASALPASAPIVAAGCGSFLAAELAERSARPCVPFAGTLPAGRTAEPADPGWADVCAPSLAVALLAARE